MKQVVFLCYFLTQLKMSKGNDRLRYNAFTVKKDESGKVDFTHWFQVYDNDKQDGGFNVYFSKSCCGFPAKTVLRLSPPKPKTPASVEAGETAKGVTETPIPKESETPKEMPAATSSETANGTQSQ